MAEDDAGSLHQRRQQQRHGGYDHHARCHHTRAFVAHVNRKPLCYFYVESGAGHLSLAHASVAPVTPRRFLFPRHLLAARFGGKYIRESLGVLASSSSSSSAALAPNVVLFFTASLLCDLEIKDLDSAANDVDV